MKINNFILFLIVFAFLQACGDKHVSYRKTKDDKKEQYPTHLEKEQSFYLIGDVGHGLRAQNSPAIEALKRLFESSPPKKEDFVLFLGDNSEATALVGDDQKAKAAARAILDRQIALVEEVATRPVFIPGENDWDETGMKGLEKEAEYLSKALDQDDVLMPNPGCPLKFVDISDKVHLIILDSQWYLNNWDNHPSTSDDCPEIKTREAMFLEVETELKKNQNKTTILALHHPLYSNGVHGGNFYLTPFLSPSEEKNPIPVLGSVAMLLRTSAGLSPQDKLNKRYKELVGRLETISTKWGKVVFASGHDHSLQYLEHHPVKQIISGSGAISSPAGLRNDGLFAYDKTGFAVFDVFEDGSSWVSFYGTEGEKPVLLYQKEVFGPDKEYPVEQLQNNFKNSITTSVYPEQKEEIESFIGDFWGQGYRKFYTEQVKLPVVELDTLYGGLEPMRMGGGHQTNSLRVRDSLGREYNFRKLQKDPLQFIQTALYLDKPIFNLFEGTVLEHLIKGFYTASHPYGFMAVPTLAEAAGVLHTNPDLFYLPKQPELGKYNFEHGDALYMIEERPEEHWLDHESFGAPNHDIQSTAGLFDRLRRDEKYRLDESSYVRARIFDMFLGDWDRHNDQWRWAEFDRENGDHVFKPIPRDRDQVFSNFDGTFFGILRSTVGMAKRFAVYDADIKDLERYSDPALPLDRTLLQNSARDTWITQAKHLQQKLTDRKIEEAFLQLPPEIQGNQTEELIQKVKARRDNLVDLAKDYYDYLSNIVILKGTDKDDFFDITRLENGATRVVVSRNKDGNRKDTIVDRTFIPSETKEVIVYGLDDDDQFYATGEGKSDILIRLVGGQDEDLYNVQNGDHLKIYDHRTSKNEVEQLSEADLLFTDDFDVNFYDPNRRDPTRLDVAPRFSYNPDDGAIIGLKGELQLGNLVEYPWSTGHNFKLNYFSRTRGFDLKYAVELKNYNRPYNFLLRFYYSSPNHTRNFFGWGNQTEYSKEDPWGYNRIRLEQIKGELGFINKSQYGHKLKSTAVFETIKVMRDENGILFDKYEENLPVFERQFFGGIVGSYDYENYDSALVPTSGLNLDLSAGGKINLEDGKAFAFIRPSLDLYNAISRNRKLVLHSKLRSRLNFGKYQFYQAPSIGGDYGLRGYRAQRFTGDHAVAVGGDLLYHFDSIRNSILPFQLSVFGGYDLGRVWLQEEDSQQWHDNYGGGVHINIAQALGSKLSLFKSEEGWRFTFGLGLHL